jgi:hypothetical protein
MFGIGEMRIADLEKLEPPLKVMTALFRRNITV